LLVYVGGTLVLVIFGVMLTAQGPFISMKTGPAEWAIAALVGLLLYGVIAASLLVQPIQLPPADVPARPANSLTSLVLGEVFMNAAEVAPVKDLTGFPEGITPPRRTRMGYLLPFEIVSVHLLVVLIGAAYLARAKRRRGAES
jgi:NADH:ubiquinone oxidoreductase subunit 6 (subunit J)